MEELIKEMEGMELIVISSGVGHLNPYLNLDFEKETIDVNVSGFVVMSNVAYKYFASKNSGHIVGISSIGALMANPTAPAYNASKTFVSNYLISIRQKVNIVVTDVKCGFVDTNMAKGDKDKIFWVASPEKAALQIYNSIKKKKQTVYVSKRLRIIAWVLKMHLLFN